ncbi:alpha/beta hydrolase [Pseudomonas inefficax]|uniref:alpha/beta hydrolase n=1 Tax=Pseudomonas inefficax TaxID=2078786 RepID=UPI004046AFF9
MAHETCHPHPVQTSGPAPEACGSAIILIHGPDQSPADMFVIAGRINLPAACYIAIEAPKQWLSLKDSTGEIPTIYEPTLQSLDLQICDLQRRGVDRSRIVLLGFSQGACLACEYIYRNPARWGGLIAFTGGLAIETSLARKASGQLHGTPIQLSNGDRDPWISLQCTEATLEIFREMGGDAALDVYPGREHLVDDEEILESRAIIQRVLP